MPNVSTRITATQIPPEQWIRGDFQPIAQLLHTADEMERRLGAQFIEWFEDGLGHFRAAGFVTADGRQFGLSQYLHGSAGPGVVITCLHDEHFSTDLDDVLESIDMGLSDVANSPSGPSISAEVKLVPHALWRLDDNGVRTLVSVCRCRADARKRMSAFEAAAHKQTYWVEPYKA